MCIFNIELIFAVWLGHTSPNTAVEKAVFSALSGLRGPHSDRLVTDLLVYFLFILCNGLLGPVTSSGRVWVCSEL